MTIATRDQHLLLAGLDHYFSGRYEQAIDVWTRALFFDRSHARARATSIAPGARWPSASARPKSCCNEAPPPWIAATATKRDVCCTRPSRAARTPDVHPCSSG